MTTPQSEFVYNLKRGIAQLEDEFREFFQVTPNEILASRQQLFTDQGTKELERLVTLGLSDNEIKAAALAWIDRQPLTPQMKAYILGKLGLATAPDYDLTAALHPCTWQQPAA